MSTTRESALPNVRLLTDELHRGPWVWGRNVAPPDGPLEGGALVEVEDASGRFVGHALWNGASDIRLRWLARGRKSALRSPRAFLTERLRVADRLRRRVLGIERASDAYRIAHAEGDELPGLVVDRLGGTLVCEYHALGFWRLRAEVEGALAALYPEHALVRRVPPGAARSEGFTPAADELGPEPAEVWIEEHGIRYPVLPGRGHKTGWFCDQRANRVRLGALAAGKSVLDLCCNAGGFALQAARQGARRVRAVDLDEVVLERARRAGEQNGLDVDWIHADAFHVLRAVAAAPERERPDVLVLDPHKLIPGKADLESGRRKYGELNALAFQALRPGGLLFTFSCSGALDLPGFLGIVFGAARRAEREPRLLEIVGAGPDHPQLPDWPRSRYLKGALLWVPE